EVLKGVDLEVKQGEVVSIIGPSGSGKSTILRCLTGLETADSGEIQINGSTGLVFQQFNLFPHWSVLKNLMDPQMSVDKKSKEEAEKKARETLARMDLSDKADSYPYQLSGGQQQRVAIARALCMSPDVLFFDEPTSALDPELTGEILKVIKQLADQKMTMVIVTHEMAFAKGISDKVYFMEGGSWLAQGTPEEIFENSDNERIRNFINTLNNTF
ncbi:MAG: amino acid ABC transporter ATP-binding protein, partial [Firmicutes bacterium]|nr:amino acid ABC transporter ATP-binding protein [Bacillota bacterium]